MLEFGIRRSQVEGIENSIETEWKMPFLYSIWVWAKFSITLRGVLVVISMKAEEYILFEKIHFKFNWFGKVFIFWWVCVWLFCAFFSFWFLLNSTECRFFFFLTIKSYLLFGLCFVVALSFSYGCVKVN